MMAPTTGNWSDPLLTSYTADTTALEEGLRAAARLVQQFATDIYEVWDQWVEDDPSAELEEWLSDLRGHFIPAPLTEQKRPPRPTNEPHPTAGHNRYRPAWPRPPPSTCPASVGL